jgi:hypothetical protein
MRSAEKRAEGLKYMHPKPSSHVLSATRKCALLSAHFRVADNPRIWVPGPDLFSHHLGESWDLTLSEVRSYKSSTRISAAWS